MALPVRVVLAAAIAAGILKLAISPSMDPVWLGAAFGAAYLACAAWWHRRRSLAALSVLVLLFLAEISGLPVYERTGLGDWLVQMAGACIWLAGLAGAAGVIRARRAESRRRALA